MNRLLSAAADLVAMLSPTRIKAIADEISEKQRNGNERLYKLVSTPAARSAMDNMLASWEQSTISGDLVAGILMGASFAHHKGQKEAAELVWTGPTTSFVPTRRTEQVLLDLIRRAQRELFLVSFVAYDVPTVAHELNAAHKRGIEVRILLESSSLHGGSLLVDPVATMRTQVPSALLFAWTDRPNPFTGGRVHAKVAVADDSIAFLTSANLTGHALEKNMEAGVVISGGRIAADLRNHLHALINTKIITQVSQY